MAFDAEAAHQETLALIAETTELTKRIVTEIERLRAQLAEAQEALRPFATLAHAVPDDWADDASCLDSSVVRTPQIYGVKAGDLRRAARVLAALEGTTGQSE